MILPYYTFQRFVKLALFLSILLISASAVAQDTPLPILSDINRLALAVSIRDVQIAQLQVENANLKLQSATDAIQRLLLTLQHPGFTLNLQSGKYEPTPDTPTVKPATEDSK